MQRLKFSEVFGGLRERFRTVPDECEEYTGRERSPPPDPAESAAAEIPVPNSPTPTGRTFQDNFNSPQMPASPTGGQGLTQEALIEVLRNQHQNIVSTAELDRWTRSTNFRTDQASFRSGSDAD